MKNSKEYALKLGKLYRQLKRKYPKLKKTTYEDPTEAIVYAIISENISENETKKAMEGIASKFVDLNDLRVSSIDEIVEATGLDNTAARETAGILTKNLKMIYDKYHFLNMEWLKKNGKRPAKQLLEKMSMSRFVIDYCMLTSLQGHAIPLTKKMLGYLKQEEIVYPEATEDEIEGFLTNQISADEAYEFYRLLRQESESIKETKTGGKEKKAVKEKKVSAKSRKEIK